MEALGENGLQELNGLQGYMATRETQANECRPYRWHINANEQADPSQKGAEKRWENATWATREKRANKCRPYGAAGHVSMGEAEAAGGVRVGREIKRELLVR